MNFHGNQIGDMVQILLVKNFLLTFQMNNSKYDYWILQKKIVLDKMSILFIKLLISPLILA